MVDYSNLPVDASPEDVQAFMVQNREKYIESLSQVRQIVTAVLNPSDIYKVYGRDDKQGGEALKDVRKIRLKFNSYNKGKEKGSLWNIPDIAGFTIVVAYPSQISLVCNKIDSLIDSGTLLSVYPPPPSESEKDKKNLIKSKHGRTFVSQGYLGCHYNLRVPKLDRIAQPICEVQIKSVLFDAWGAKTHDLTYKTAAQVDQSLVQGFEVLGDTLAKIDQQSDILREAIERQHAVRDFYKKQNVIFKTRQLLQRAYEAVPELEEMDAASSQISKNTSYLELLQLQSACHRVFQMSSEERARKDSDYQKWTSIALFFAGLRCNNKSFISDAREALITWERMQTSAVNRLHAMGISALVNFCGGEKISAVTESERAVKFADSVAGKLPNEENERFFNCYSSIVSSLAYYHADLIGSHEGRLQESSKKAMKFIELLDEINPKLARPLPRAADDEEKVLKAVRDTDRGISNFMSLDNELHVRILTSSTLDAARAFHAKLELLHKNPPRGLETEAGLLWQYHDYCARAHITELELVHLGSSQP